MPARSSWSRVVVARSRSVISKTARESFTPSPMSAKMLTTAYIIMSVSAVATSISTSV